MQFYARTDVGIRRQTNQDYYITKDNIFVLADGMGGHNAGEVASKVTVDYVYEYICENISKSPPINLLKQAFKNANTTVYEKSIKNPKYEDMGTTCVAAIILNEHIYIANVGDSRLYLVRNGELRKITVDHSVVEELLLNNAITEEEARVHPLKNVITRAIGTNDNVVVDIYVEKLMVGDIFLVCTDGLNNMLTDESILSIINNKKLTIKDKVDTLIDEANKSGGLDNITVILIAIQNPEGVEKNHFYGQPNIYEVEK